MAINRWFIVAVICFLFGIVLCEMYLDGEYERFLVVLFLFFVVIKWFFEIFKVGYLGLIVFCLLFLIIGGGRFWLSFYNVNVEVGKWMEIEGCVVEESDVRSDKVKYVVEVDGFEGRILVNGSRYPVYEFGDCLKIAGKLQKPEEIDGFAYDDYLSRYSIYYVIYKAEIEKISSGDGVSFFGLIYKLKGIFEQKLNQIYTEPYGGFMAGLILGSRKGISESLMQSFNATGLTHIIAVSGYNVALVIVIVSGIFSFFSRRIKVLLSMFFIFAFVILVGASASVVRAGIMGTISLMALFFGRQYYVFLSLMACAFIMNLWNPKILVYDVGFQLSFLATVGIVIFSPVLEGLMRWVPQILGLREALQLTLSAQITVLPIIILNFERFSIIAPIANVFVLPFIPMAMLFGFIAVIFGRVFGFFGYVILKIIIVFVEFFAKLEFASVNVKWNFYIGALYFYFLARFCISRFCLCSSSSE